MKQILLAFILALTPVSSAWAAETTGNVYADILQQAYPEAGLQFETAKDGLYARIGGDRILVEAAEQGVSTLPADAVTDRLADSPKDPPLAAIFTFVYPTGPEGRFPTTGYDPGRIRNEAFLKALYGASKEEVGKNCVSVDFLGKKITFNKRHGAAAALSRVAERLKPQLAADPELRAYIFPLAGTFYWRNIKGLPRLSAHSFGIAIDLNVEKGIYWQWVPAPTPQKIEQTRKTYPQAIVDAFEAEGFVWGGKWAAFDFMHFEYRPEMLLFRGK